MYRIRFVPSAEREFLKLPQIIRNRVASHIDSLAVHPRPHGCKKLAGASGHWRIRIGDYRVVYSVRDDQLLVIVVQVAHRRDVYRGL